MFRFRAAWAVPVAGLATAVLLTSLADAFPMYLEAWKLHYPGSTLPARMFQQTGEECSVCHHPPFKTNEGNCYRRDIIGQLDRGRTIQEAIAFLDGVDSDGDGFTNGQEILMPHEDLEGEVGYNPGLIGEQGTDPCSFEPNRPVTRQRETPSQAGCPNPQNGCESDVNGDCRVDLADLAALLAAFNSQPGDGNWNADADFNEDGRVDLSDLALLLAQFNNDCN